MLEFEIFIETIMEGIKNYLGGCDLLVTALIKMAFVCCVTETMCMIREKKIKKDVWIKEIPRWISVFLLVGVANMLDTQIIGAMDFFRTGTICFYISKAGIRILENIVKLDVPVPKKIRMFVGLLGDGEGNK